MRTREGRAKRGGDEGSDGQEADQRDVPPVNGEDDRHRGNPQQRHQGRDRLGAIGPMASGSRLKFLFAWFGHCPPSGATGSS